MSDKAPPGPHADNKSPLQILRERRGGVPRELVQRNQQQDRVRRSILDLLRGGPKTVPELAREGEIPTHDVLWHVMGMKKYGKVIESEQVDGYFKYALTTSRRST